MPEEGGRNVVEKWHPPIILQNQVSSIKIKRLQTMKNVELQAESEKWSLKNCNRSIQYVIFWVVMCLVWKNSFGTLNL